MTLLNKPSLSPAPITDTPQMQAPAKAQALAAFNRRKTLALLASAPWVLTACSKPEEAAKAAPQAVSTAQGFERVVAEGKGFTVGAMMSATTVYVLFDPQCPHCGHLWEQARPLLKRVKFVWMPVAFINAKSAPQGAALLSAANPQETMDAHEASILAKSGGMSAPASIPDDLSNAIKKNTELLNAMGVGSVPYLMAKNSTTGTVITHEGAMETAALEKFIGLN